MQAFLFYVHDTDRHHIVMRLISKEVKPILLTQSAKSHDFLISNFFVYLQHGPSVVDFLDKHASRLTKKTLICF